MVVIIDDVGSCSTILFRHTALPVTEVGKQVALPLPKYLCIICLHECLMKFKSISVSSSHKFALALGNIYPAYLVLCIFICKLSIAVCVLIEVVTSLLELIEFIE